jgi:hypothetical protein
MLARQIVVVSQAPDVGAYVADALQIAGCRLEVATAAEVVPADALADSLCVVVVDDDPRTVTDVLARMRGAARAIVVLAQPSLAATIEWLASSERVSAVVALEGLEPSALNRLATKVLAGQSVDIEDARPGDTTVQTHVFDSERMKQDCLSRLVDYAAKLGVSSRLRTAIEQACDELATNALYAAPVDADGRRVFGELTSADRVRFKLDAPVTVRFAGNTKQFVLSVRDEFGSMTRETPLRFLHKGVHATDKVDRKIAGAGLGLYLLASQCAAVHLHLEYGIATEITCVFDLTAAQPALRQLALHAKPGDSNQVAARAQARNLTLRAVRMPGAGRKWLIGGAAAAVVAAAAVGVGWRMMSSRAQTLSLSVTSTPPTATLTVDGRPLSGSVITGLRPGTPITIAATQKGYVGQRVVVTPRAGHAPVTITLAPASALVDIDSTPPGATALIGGKPVGETPVVVRDLEPGSQIEITLQRPGYADAIVRTVVPPTGGRSELREPLSPAPGFASVRIESTPPGARIVDTKGTFGKVARFTPADLVLSTSEDHSFVLAMPHHLPVALPPFKAEAGMTRTAALVAAAEIQLESDRPGAATATVKGVPHCAAVELPGSCAVSPGSYEVEIRAAGQPTQRRTVAVAADDVVIRY